MRQSGQIIHTSLREMTSTDSDFPNSKPTPGVLARAVYHRNYQRTMVEIYHETPIVISPGKGEFIEADIEQVDSKVRELLINISERCRAQGEELLAYSERLLNLVSEDKIIDDIKEQIDNGITVGDIVSTKDSSNNYIDVSYSESKKRRSLNKGDKAGKGKSNRLSSKSSELLDLLEDTLDEDLLEGSLEEGETDSELDSELDSDDLLDILSEE